jgi:hypothetical protein
MTATHLSVMPEERSAEGTPPILPRRSRAVAVVGAPASEVFAYLDAPARLSSHMAERSWMMGGGRMEIRPDRGGGARVGSEVMLVGRAFGMALEVRVVVTEHAPPFRKAWHTAGTPHLLIIGAYRMAFGLQPDGKASRLEVIPEYALPGGGAWLLGWLFGPVYARWCTQRMVRDAVRYFEVHEVAV